MVHNSTTSVDTTRFYQTSLPKRGPIPLLPSVDTSFYRTSLPKRGPISLLPSVYRTSLPKRGPIPLLPSVDARFYRISLPKRGSIPLLSKHTLILIFFTFRIGSASMATTCHQSMIHCVSIIAVGSSLSSCYDTPSPCCLTTAVFKLIQTDCRVSHGGNLLVSE